MARVVWTDPGFESLEDARRYIAQHSRRTALSVVERIVQATRQLETFPDSGRLLPDSDEPDVREIIVVGYRVIYRVIDDDVEILLVRHGSRRLGDIPGL
jgi:toxin ParE1/3/4